MRVVTFKVDENLLMMLDRYAINNGLNRSEAIRKAIEMLTKEEMSKEKARVEAIRL
ncbi:ribbon-helix-helix protein, CopG family [Sulfolobus tengchongensis]|uniref:Ribbon-helix-helix protein, CopG family n=1 Tax=Sulfolobus tengchongensis TaxID=207809 RepID=A0AAX4KZX0_9CREN